MASSLLEEIRLKYGGTDEEAIHEKMAMEVTAVSYGGMRFPSLNLKNVL